MRRSKKWQKLREIAELISNSGMSLKDGAAKYGIPVRELYYYNREVKRQQLAAEQGESAEADELLPTPQSSVPDEIEKIIVDYRTKNPDHGFKKIANLLKHKHHVVVTSKRIRKVLKEHDLLGHDSSFDKVKRAKGTRRFEAGSPRELYQMDVTSIYITGIPVLYLVCIIDDHSRFCVGSELCLDHRGDRIISVFHQACLHHGKPQKVLTDQGREFYTWSHNQTQFQQYLDDMQIEHIVSEPHSPQTSGKIERFFQSLKKELLGQVRFNDYDSARQGIAQFIYTYNHDRPHQGIDGARPADRFYGVSGEIARVEGQLLSRSLDVSKGYLLFKVQGQLLSVVVTSGLLQVYLDGVLLKPVGNADDLSS